MCPQRGSCRQTSIMHCSMDRRSFGIRKGTACFANRRIQAFAPDLQAEEFSLVPFGGQFSRIRPESRENFKYFY